MKNHQKIFSLSHKKDSFVFRSSLSSETIWIVWLEMEFLRNVRFYVSYDSTFGDEVVKYFMGTDPSNRSNMEQFHFPFWSFLHSNKRKTPIFISISIQQIFHTNEHFPRTWTNPKNFRNNFPHFSSMIDSRLFSNDLMDPFQSFPPDFQQLFQDSIFHSIFFH